jgi:transcription antitermination factor NusB
MALSLYAGVRRRLPLCKKMLDHKLAKHLSRIAAVQVMYQKDVTNDEVSSIVDNDSDFIVCDGTFDQRMHRNFFRRLISKFDEDIDFKEIIERSLEPETRIVTAPVIMKSIIKVGIVEIVFEKTAVPIIINEYVEIAKKFIGVGGGKFVNAILDKIANQVERRCKNET